MANASSWLNLCLGFELSTLVCSTCRLESSVFHDPSFFIILYIALLFICRNIQYVCSLPRLTFRNDHTPRRKVTDSLEERERHHGRCCEVYTMACGCQVGRQAVRSDLRTLQFVPERGLTQNQTLGLSCLDGYSKSRPDSVEEHARTAEYRRTLQRLRVVIRTLN